MAALWGPVSAFVVGIAALAAGTFGVGGLAVLAGTAHLAPRLRIFQRPRAVDHADLSARFHAVPDELVESLFVLCAGRALTTRDLMQSAQVRSPQLWAPLLLARDPGETAWDGPALEPQPAQGPCTQFAAEAVALAGVLGQALGKSIDENLLAVAAAAIPLSAAAEWAPDLAAVGERILGVDSAHFSKALAEFSRTPAGADLERRVAVIVKAGPEVIATVPRDQLLLVSQRRLDAYRVLSSFALPLALITAPYWMPRDWYRGRHQRKRRHSTARAAPRARRKPAGAFKPWAAWSLVTRIAWLGIRPLLLVLAIASPLAAGDVGWIAWLWLAAVTLLCRPLRRWWLNLPLIAVVAPVALFAAAALAIRAGLTELVLQRLGRVYTSSWKAARSLGLNEVLAGRRRLARVDQSDIQTLSEAVDAAAAAGDDDEAADKTLELIVANWADGRPLGATRAVRTLVRGMLFGTWSNAPRVASFESNLLRLYVTSSASGLAVRGFALVLSSALAAAVFTMPGEILGVALPKAVTAVIATLLVALPATARAPSPSGVVTGAVAAVVLVRADAWQPLVVAVIAGLGMRAARTAIDTLVIAGRNVNQGWPIPRGPRRLRQHWQAAEQALQRGDEALAIQMFHDLAVNAQSKPDIQAAALGRAAYLELGRGRYEAASAALDRLTQYLETRPTGAPDREPVTAAAAGLVAAGLGEADIARAYLQDAVPRLAGESTLRAEAGAVLADVLVRSGAPDDAIAVLAAPRPRLSAFQGLHHLIDSEVSVCSALAQQGEPDRAERRLLDLLRVSMTDDLDQASLSRDAVDRVVIAEARAFMLAGRLALTGGRPHEAEPHLRRALGRLSVAGSELSATANVLHGSALIAAGALVEGVAAIRVGVETIEERRSQLRTASRRTALVVADADLYAWALGSLAVADKRGVDGAGAVAATLIESLRRSAISRTLRAGSLPLTSEARALVDQIASLEMRSDDDSDTPSAELRLDRSERADVLDELRHRLAQEVSAQFAAAYLPSTVTVDQLRGIAARYGHVLTYHVPPGALEGWWAWISPIGEIHVGEIGIAKGAAYSVLGALASAADRRQLNLHEPVAFGADPSWSDLADALLPGPLREQLVGAAEVEPTRLLIVPDGPLTLVPWAALRVDGLPLVAKAAIQIVPALELLTQPSSVPTNGYAHIVAHLDDGLPGYTDEVRALSTHPEVSFTSSRDAFLNAINTRSSAGAYLATHGEGVGLEQHVVFADGSLMSAASALGQRWPRWAVFASCLVGRVDQLAGREPLGLVVSCMLGGCESVVASVIELTSSAAPQVCGDVVLRLVSGAHPADAVRDAQLKYLAGHELASIADCLGLVCVSGAPPRTASAVG